MKKIYILLFAFFTSFAFSQTVIFQDSFESGTTGTMSESCNDNAGDFFTITDGTDIGSWYEVTNMDGSMFLAAMDTDGTPCTMTTETLIYDDINIANYTNLSFSALFAEDDDGTNEDWDDSTIVSVSVDVDNSGTFTKIIQFAAVELRADGTSSTSNKQPALDTDLDGIGDGAFLSPTFTEYSASITSGNLLDIKIEFIELDSGDEDISIDNIRITGTTTASTEAFEKNNFSIYPNPTNTGLVNIKTTSNEAVSVSVFNILGKQVINTTLSNNTLDVSNLNTGVYILRLSQNGNTTTKKLVIN